MGGRSRPFSAFVSGGFHAKATSLQARTSFLGFSHGINGHACCTRPISVTPYLNRRACVGSDINVTRACADAKDGDAETGDLSWLQSDDFLVRIRGITRVQEFTSSTTEVLDAILPIVKSEPNPQVRYTAVSQLSNLERESLSDEDKETILSVAKNMMESDSDPSCQSAAADVIAALGITSGFDALVEVFNTTSDWMLKFTIAAGMGELGDPRAFEFLTGVLETTAAEGEELLLGAVIGALGDVRNPEALPAIEQYLEHPDQAVKERAKIAKNILTAAA